MTQAILNVRRDDFRLALTGQAHHVAKRLGVPLDGMLELLLAHGYCRVKHAIDGVYFVTFRSAKS